MTRKLVAISDDEFTPLLQRFVQKGLVSKCEIHGVKKIERWITQHGGGKVDVQVLKSYFRWGQFYICLFYFILLHLNK